MVPIFCRQCRTGIIFFFLSYLVKFDKWNISWVFVFCFWTTLCDAQRLLLALHLGISKRIPETIEYLGWIKVGRMQGKSLPHYNVSPAFQCHDVNVMMASLTSPASLSNWPVSQLSKKKVLIFFQLSSFCLFSVLVLTILSISSHISIWFQSHLKMDNYKSDNILFRKFYFVKLVFLSKMKILVWNLIQYF